METISILGVSLGVGVVVYALSLRSADAPVARGASSRSPLAWFRGRAGRPVGEQLGFGEEPAGEPAEPAPEGFVYVPVLASTRTEWRTRVVGLVGLVAMVAIGAIVLALGAYQLGSLINKTIAGFLGN